MKKVILLLLLAFSLKSYSQSENIIGKWAVQSKIETKKTGDAVTESDKELYKSGEKFFEFTSKQTLIITENYGKRTEKLPYKVDGNKIYIGKKEKNKMPYIFDLKDNSFKLVKTETKIKKGKDIVITEEVVMQKNN